MVRITGLDAEVCDVNGESFWDSRNEKGQGGIVYEMGCSRSLSLSGTNCNSLESAYLKGMPKRILFRATRVLTCIVVVLCFLWLYFYIDSVRQRRKAERLLAELAALPPMAGFAQVRDFTIRYGGGPTQTNEHPARNRCTPQDCWFQVEMLPATTKLLRQQERLLNVLYLTEDHAGLRPWMVTIWLKVQNGTLQHTEARVLQQRMSRSIIYKVDIDRTATVYSQSGNPSSDYVVISPHITGAPGEALIASAVQTPSGKWKRTFDIQLDCLTTVLRGCVDFRQLAPSAWADYEAARKSM
jgi:hypothetical protein